MIDPTLVDLLNPNGFNALFEKNLRDLKNGTHVQAYEATESVLVQNFGRKKYSSYQSFRQVRNRKLKSRWNLIGVFTGIKAKCF